MDKKIYDENMRLRERVTEFEYNADLRLVLENWGVAIPSPEAEAAFDRVIEHNRRYGCYAT